MHTHTHTHTYTYLTAQKSNFNTVWFNFQTYYYTIFSINLVSQVTLRSSGTDILYVVTCLDVCIIYFISRDYAYTHTHIYLTAQKSNSNTVWFNFQMYTIFRINLV
jgi:hypothetical protein